MQKGNPSSWLSNRKIFQCRHKFLLYRKVNSTCSSELDRHVRGTHRHQLRLDVGGAAYLLLLMLSCLLSSLTLKTEKICSSETSDPLRNTRRYSPEDLIFHLPAAQILLTQEFDPFAIRLFLIVFCTHYISVTLIISCRLGG
jgi:hypothetical protein